MFQQVDCNPCFTYMRRPGWQEFLASTAKKYEMHVYTMGTRAYAEEVCAAIDPDRSIFGGRILSRDESGSTLIYFAIHAFIHKLSRRSNAEESPPPVPL